MIAFICDPCKNTADDASKRTKISPALLDPNRNGHGLCRGSTWCDCQHRMKKA